MKIEDVLFKQKIFPFYDLLGIDVDYYVLFPVTEIRVSNKFLHKELRKIKLLHETGNFKQRDLELIPFLELFNELKGLRQHNKKAFDKFSKLLINCEKDQYFGIRMEINVAAILLMKKISYETQERPDFKITLDNQRSCYIECTSRHLSKSKTKDIIFKSLIDTIKSKNHKEYMSYSTALFVDITNIINLHPKMLGNDPDHAKEIRTIIKDELEKNTVGSVVFNYWILQNRRLFANAYTRVDSSKIDPILTEFLDQTYKIEILSALKNIHVPTRG